MRRAIFFSLLTGASACATSATVGSPSPDAASSYIVRRGMDTIALERYTLAGNRVESSLIQREPSTFIQNSNIELGANGLMTSWRFETRLANGSRPNPSAATVTWTFSADSSFSQVVRDTGAALSRRIAGGPAVPSLGNSMLTNNLAIVYARMQNRDTLDVPTMGTGGGRGSIPIRFITRDSIRVWYFGFPMYAKLDADGQIRWLDGAATPNKISAIRTNRLDINSVAYAYAARDAAGNALGLPSSRDTTRAQIMGNAMWIDYGRPRLSGRNVWSNGVLGDTIWRTGANNATHFYTARDIRMNGVTVPAGTYTLWTHVFPRNARYELIVHRRIGQWGTEPPEPSQDLVRVPLRERSVSTSAERVTITIEPAGDGGVIAIQWGTKRLEAPFSVVR
jgi:hypothetical protein